MKKRTIIILLASICLVLLITGGAVVGGMLAQRWFSNTSAALAFSPRQELSEQEKGLLVAGVAPESPALEAGLKRGDILLSVDGKEVNTLMDLKEIVESKKSGDQLELSVLHGDEQLSLTATLGELKMTPFLGIFSCGPGIVERDFIYRFPPERGSIAVSAEGTTVVEVVPDSPAYKAGLEQGDRILSVDGEKVTPEEDLAKLIGAHQPGDSVVLEVARIDKEETQKITVTLSEHPQEEGKPYLGVSYAPTPEVFIEGERLPKNIPFPPFIRPEEEFDHFQLPEGITSGMIVGKVIEGSPADKAGLQKGDLITAIDGESIDELNPEEFVKTIRTHKPGEKITLSVYRNEGEESLEIQATLGENPEKAGEAYLGIEAMGFIKIDKSGEPGRDFHFEFKLPEWFHHENQPDGPVRFEIFQTGEET